MHLFYTPDITSDIYTLSEEESKHAVRVLRLKTGDHIQLIDGSGGFYEAEIIDDHQKRCTVKIISKQTGFGKRNWKLHIAIAPTKNNDRMEWFIEKATEIGIEEITPLDCDKSERTVIKTERFNKVAISAIKQSLKAYLPVINELTEFKKFIATTSGFSGEKFIAHCHSREALPHIKTVYTPQQNTLILIGPEGDFSTEEVKLATENGFKEISLGQSRLRTETAALYACVTINMLNND
jgi:16S rRNA (uracil1498-N3)-methyltransferase